MNGRRCNYTLLELVAAIGVLLLLFGIALVNFANFRLEETPAAQIGRVRRLGALCRRAAIAQGKPVGVMFRPAERTLQGSGETVVLPEHMTLRINGAELLEDGVAMLFFPDGNAAEVTMEITAENEAPAVLRVSPLTGMMEVYEED